MINPDTIKPLVKKEIPIPEWYADTNHPERLGWWNEMVRVIFFDPTEIYQRIEPHIDIKSRIQKNLNTEKLFPKRDDGICRCGCNRQTHKMWFDETCSEFAYRIYFLIAYGTGSQNIKKLMATYYGKQCQREGCESSWEDIDHVIPVVHGGGACWISNFMPLCKVCHKDKTKKDFKWKEYKPTLQIKLEL